MLDHFFGSQPLAALWAPARRFKRCAIWACATSSRLRSSDKNYEETIPLGDGATRATDEIKRMSASEAKTAASLDR